MALDAQAWQANEKVQGDKARKLNSECRASAHAVAANTNRGALTASPQLHSEQADEAVVCQSGMPGLEVQLRLPGQLTNAQSCSKVYGDWPLGAQRAVSRGKVEATAVPILPPGSGLGLQPLRCSKSPLALALAHEAQLQ